MEPWKSPPSAASAFDPRHSNAWHRTERDEILDGQEKDRKLGME